MNRFQVTQDLSNDFSMVQNYVLQLRAEKVITSDAFVLYTFYKSVSGFKQINVGYGYINANTGLSKGNITKCNKLLAGAGLIKVVKKGPHVVHEIKICPEHKLPRRVMKDSVDKKISPVCSSGELKDEKCSSDECHVSQDMNTSAKKCSSGEGNIDTNINNSINTKTTTEELDLDIDQYRFLEKFTQTWCERTDSFSYPKKDLHKVKMIEDIKEATFLIPVLWSLDETDKWVRASDHSITVFIKELESGKLQNMYPKTRYYMEDMKRRK